MKLPQNPKKTSSESWQEGEQEHNNVLADLPQLHRAEAPELQTLLDLTLLSLHLTIYLYLLKYPL